MSFWHNVLLDLQRIESSSIKAVLFNRGFHALFTYRIAHMLWNWRVPVIPMILTRIIQIFYSIDIDWRTKIGGGCIILHGMGTVIGSGVTIGKNATIFHGVTIGMSWSKNREDGFPVIGDHVLLGAGAKLLGPISVGNNAKVGANAVVLHDVPANSVAVGFAARVIPKKLRIKRII